MNEMNEFNVSSFLEMVYEDAVNMTEEPLERLGDWVSYKAGQKERIRDILRLSLLEQRYQIPQSYELLSVEMEDDIEIRKYKVNAIRKLPLSVLVLMPGGKAGCNKAECEKAGCEKAGCEKEGCENEGDVGTGEGKAVLFLNGHDNRGAAGAYQRVKPDEKVLCMELARMGYFVLVPELFAFGEAKRQEDGVQTGACESCARTEPWLLNSGLNLVGLRVLEAMKTMDFAEALLDIHNFCAYGISGGGHICNYTGILDNRVDAMIVSGYPNLYKYSTLPLVHCICNYVPAQMELGESYYITALAAPEKKLLVMNGKEDSIFPIQGSRIVFEYLKEVYEKLGAGERFTSVLFDGGHEIAVEPVCDWMRLNYKTGN